MRGWPKIDLGQGPTPHAEGGFGTETGKLTLQADYLPPAEVADAALAERFPLAMITPKTHLFLNSTFANQKDDQQGRSLTVLLLDASSSGATVGPASLDAESCAGGNHRRLAGVNGGDDLGVVDPLQIDGGDAEVGMP